MNAKRQLRGTTIETLRVALNHGGFQRSGECVRLKWHHRGRTFSNTSIRTLLDSGEAERIGDKIVAVVR